MATNSNTLNDVRYQDENILNGKKVTTPAAQRPGPEYDYVLSFFVKVMKDKGAASTFAQAIYEVANQTQTDVLEILKTLDTSSVITLSATMAYYLNGLRSSATLLGVENPIIPNYYAGRNVLG